MTSAAVVVVCLWLAVQARAAVITVNVVLDGLQEVPTVATPGYGAGTVTFNTVTRNVSVLGTFSGLIDTTTTAHVHGLAPEGSMQASSSA